MGVLESLLLASGIAYLCGAMCPRPLTDKQFALEKLGFFVMAMLVLGNLLLLKSHILWLILGIVFVVCSLLSYLGVVAWKVKWKEVSDEAQMCMWLWDLLIAVASFVMGGI
jgi:predicted MFS family arabinose efflux permease